MTVGRCAVLVAGALLIVALAPACSQTANVTDVFTALDGAGNRKRNEFFTDTKEIHCIAKAGVGRPGVTVEAFIRQLQAYDFPTNKYVPVNKVLAYGERELEQSNVPTTVDVVLSPGAGQPQ